MLVSVPEWCIEKRFCRGMVVLLILNMFFASAIAEQAEVSPVDSNLLSNQIVMIDPGHGGKDLGIVYQKNVVEKDYVFAVAVALNKVLKNQPNIKVLFTRDRDQTISILERTTLTNQKNSDLFISLHLSGKKLQGEEKIMMYLNRKVDESAMPELEHAKMQTSSHTIPWDLAQNGQRKESVRLAQMIQKNWSDDTLKKGQRLFSAPIAVLHGVRAPAILLELPAPQIVDQKSSIPQAEIDNTAQRLARGIISFFGNR